MASTKRRSFLWSASLTLTIVICTTVVYICISRTVENQKFSSRTAKQNSLKSEKLTDKNCIPTCGTKECVMQAKTLLSHIDSNVDPCDDAHSFLCGGFGKKIAPDESLNLIDLTEEKIWIEVKDILDNIQADPGSPSGKLKTMYDSCMDYSSTELQGALPFQKFLENDLGIANWPYLNSDFKFAVSRRSKLLGKVKFLKEFQVFQCFVPDKDQGSNYTYSVYFNSYSLNSTKVKSEGAIHALEYFDLSQEDIETIVSDVEAIQKSIVDLHASLNLTSCRENCTYTYVNCSNLSDEEWALLCETVEAHQNETTKYSGEERKDAIIIEVDDQEIVKNLLLLMDSLPDKSLANYFAFRFLWKFSEEINFYFRLTKLKYDGRTYFEDQVQPDLWKNCILWMTKNMKLSLTKEFFSQYLTTPITEQVSDYYNTSKSDINEIIERQEWIPPERKYDIISQVANLTLNIMTIKNILKNSTSLGFIEDYYEMIHPTRESFFNNVLQHYKIIDIIEGQLSGDARFARYMIEHTNFEVGANTNMREINLQYGMFMPPLYTPNIRREINRLSHAVILGHEIGHTVAFMLEEPILNDTEHIPEFLEAKECIENQFSGFKFDILKENVNGTRYNVENLADSVATSLMDKLNGTQDYSENLADSVGTTLMDKILEEYESSEQMQFLLPGVAYSTNQFLYMSAFQFFCSKENLKSEKRYEEDEHAPLKFRIIGMSQNSRSYSNLFQCSDGSRMNPAKKCSLLSNS